MGDGPNGNGNGDSANRAWIEAIRADLAAVRESSKPNWSALAVVTTVMLAFGGLVANTLFQADRDAREERHAIEADMKKLMVDVATLMERSRRNEEEIRAKP